MKFVSEAKRSSEGALQSLLKYSSSFSIFIDKLEEEKWPWETFWVNKVTVKNLHHKVELSQAPL